MNRNWFSSAWRSWAACGSALALLVSLGAHSANADSQTFNYTGAPQSFVVPTGVTSIQAQLWGAGGGGVPGLGLSGGGGAYISATLSVTPGQTLDLFVGGKGSAGSGGGAAFQIGSTGSPGNPGFDGQQGQP